MAKKKHPGYEYKTIDLVDEPEVRDHPTLALSGVDKICNRYADRGWRTVSMMIVAGSIWLLIERVKQNPYNEETEWDDWVQWNVDHLEGY